MSIFTDIKKSKLGDSLHGFRALWEGLKATSPEYQTFRNLGDLRALAQGDIGFEDFLKSGKQDFQEGIKHNWPIILGSLASMGMGGAAAGGGGTAGGAQSLPVFGVEGGMTGTGASIGSTFGGGGAGIGSGGGMVQSGLGATGPMASQFNLQDLQRMMQNQNQQQQESERERRLRLSNQLIAMILSKGNV